MRFLMKNNIVKSLAVMLLLCVSMIVQAQVPDAPNPPRLVNDFAGVQFPPTPIITKSPMS